MVSRSGFGSGMRRGRGRLDAGFNRKWTELHTQKSGLRAIPWYMIWGRLIDCFQRREAKSLTTSGFSIEAGLPDS